MRFDIDQISVDCNAPEALGRWWAQALDWEITDDDPEEFEIRPAGTGPADYPALLFVRVPENKTIKNRWHLDLRPESDQAGEVDRLIGLGATRADVGQGPQTWVVLADPEGNEFCILRARDQIGSQVTGG